jgi:hypothetical protein
MVCIFVPTESQSQIALIGRLLYVNALFGCWRPGGSTCDSAPRSGRAEGRTGAAGACPPSHAARGAVARAVAARCVRAATEKTLFSKVVQTEHASEDALV